MKTDPEIIKTLREEERLGLLQHTLSPHNQTTTTIVNSVLQHKENWSMNNKEKSRYEPKRTVIDLVSNQEKFETIFENYSVAITLADNDERIVSWNKYTEELLNMQESDLFMKPVQSLYPVEEWEKIRKENVRQKGIRYRMETKMLRKNKKPFDVDLSLCILKGFKGEIVGSIGIITDISELKNVEKELKESEKKYRTIFDNSAVAITMTNDKEQIISWNRYTERLLGMNKNDLYLRPVKELYPLEEWKKIRSQHIRQKGMQHHLETKIQKKNTERIDVDISLSVLKNHEDKIVGSIGVIKDISEQKKIEKTLKESEEKFKLLYEKAPVPYHTLAPNGHITNVNEKWCQTLGYKKEQVIGKSIFDFISKNERIKAKQSFSQKISHGKTYTDGHKREYLTKTGKKRHFITHDFFLFDEQRNIISIYTTMEDITRECKACKIENKIPKKKKEPSKSARKTPTRRKRKS